MSNQTDWLELNERYLAATVAWLRLRLLRLVSEPTTPAQPETQPKVPGGWFKRNKNNDTKRLPGPSAEADNEQITQARQAMHKPPSNARTTPTTGMINRCPCPVIVLPSGLVITETSEREARPGRIRRR